MPEQKTERCNTISIKTAGGHTLTARVSPDRPPTYAVDDCQVVRDDFAAICAMLAVPTERR